MTKNINWKALLVWVGIGTLLGWQLNTAFQNSSQIGQANTTENADLSLFGRFGVL
jgi:hypothetical protein